MSSPEPAASGSARPKFAQDHQLPSQGLLYDGKLPDGNVVLIPWRLEDIKTMISPGANPITTFDRVIDRCWWEKPFNVQDLLTGDRFFILVVTRWMTFGPTYHFKAMCKNCRKTIQHEINLQEDLRVMIMGQDDVDPFTVVMPISGAKIGLRHLRGRDEAEIQRYGKQIKPSGKADLSDPTFAYQIARQIVSIDGKDAKPLDALNWLQGRGDNELHGRDAFAILDAVEQHDCGVNLTVSANCSSCGFEDEMVMPMDTDFFRPRASRP